MSARSLHRAATMASELLHLAERHRVHARRMDDATGRGARVLVVDDDWSQRELLGDLFEAEGYEAQVAENGAAALDLIRERPFDLVLTDLHMPELDGLSLIAELRSSEITRYVPVLLITGTTDRTLKVAGLDLGANDCVSKPVDLVELLARVRSQLRLARLQEEWREGSLHDPLTGLLNRRGLLAALVRAVALAMREELPLSVLFLDIDGLKIVNDTLGHPAGDRLIKACAGAIGSALRGYDVVARVGGDEFVVVLPGAAAADTPGMVARMRRVIAAQQGQPTDLRLSMGAAALSDNAAGTYEEIGLRLLETADRAMYADKHAARRGA